MCVCVCVGLYTCITMCMYKYIYIFICVCARAFVYLLSYFIVGKCSQFPCPMFHGRWLPIILLVPSQPPGGYLGNVFNEQRHFGSPMFWTILGHVYTHVSMHIRMCTHKSLHIRREVCVHQTYINIHIYMCVCACCMCVCVCMSVCSYVRTYACTHL